MKVKKAIIPCAGFGTRFLPITKVVPKELLPIVDTPCLNLVIEEAERSGIEEVLIVLSPQKKFIKKLFKQNASLNSQLKRAGKAELLQVANKMPNVKISFAVQKKMTGNGAAIACGKRFAAGEPVAVLFGDDVMYNGEDEKPVTKQLIEAYELTNGCTVVGCQKTSDEIARRCGVMLAGEQVTPTITKVLGIVEKPQGELPSSLVSLGRFVLSPDVFDAIERTPQNEQGEVYLTDAINLLAGEGKGVCACEFDARRYDIGNKQGFLEATVEYALRDKNLGETFKQFLDTLR